jgi:hypothetical protein
MLKTDRLERFNWTGKRSINIIVNNEYKTVKVGDYFFPCVEDLNQFINKLSDISEELSEGKEEYEV